MSRRYSALVAAIDEITEELKNTPVDETSEEEYRKTAMARRAARLERIAAEDVPADNAASDKISIVKLIEASDGNGEISVDEIQKIIDGGELPGDGETEVVASEAVADDDNEVIRDGEIDDDESELDLSEEDDEEDKPEEAVKADDENLFPKDAVLRITSQLDEAAEACQKLGFQAVAEKIDVLSNTLENGI